MMKKTGQIDQTKEYTGIHLNIQTLSVFSRVFSILLRMNRWQAAGWVAGLALLGGCALPQPVTIGDSEAQVLAARGTPTHRYRIGNEQLLEYMTGPYGQQTWMARIDADGRLISFEQVLTEERFAAIKVGSATWEDVLHTIGAPSERTWLRLSRLEVWTYPYRQYDIWDSLMHVHFDGSGVVRKMENARDFRFRDMNVFGAPSPW